MKHYHEITLYLVILSINVISLPTKAVAFGTEGHNMIECWAYTQLNATFEGRLILDKLFYEKAMAGGTARKPMLRSAFPDFSLERQVYRKRQPYHLMASNHSVMWAAKRVLQRLA
jgi:hypothetical protein